MLMRGMELMIPRIIHYCWFGNSPKPELFYRCIKSWKKYCPNYKIIEWNERNFDINSNMYVKEAYEAKKWAFVTDYVRLWAIYNYGGIYLDTDVELIKSLEDLLSKPAFFGFEDKKNINTGLGFGAEKKNIIVEYMLNDYRDIHFLKNDGSFDMMTCPVRNTNSIQHFFPEKIRSNEIVEINDAVLYPTEYFCPLNSNGVTMKKTKNTYSIHWFSATWLSDEERIVHEYRIFHGKCEKYFGKNVGGFFSWFIYLFLPKKREILKKW